VFTTYIIGEESLTVQCAEVLLAQGHRILGIISTSPTIATWAQQAEIAWIDGASQWQTQLLEAEFDYLFSIVNGHLLPSNLLKKPRFLAINFHDALLPRYAGVHATSWAILNQETQHGITWHVMTDVVDSGDILEQTVVTVEPDETALSLNLKCYQAALEAFKILVAKLSSQTYIRTQQAISERTYFGHGKKVPSNGLISWNSDAKDIDRLYRALNFGDYTNRLGAAKIQISSSFYIIGGLYQTNVLSKLPPGTVEVSYANPTLCIATHTTDICITELRTLTGHVCDIEAMLAQGIIQVGTRLPLLQPEFCTAYERLSSQLFKHEAFWVNQLRAFKLATLPFIPTDSRLNTTAKTEVACFTLSDEQHLALQQQFPDETIETLLFAVWLVYLYRIGNRDNLGINVAWTEKDCTEARLCNLVSDTTPFQVAFDDEIAMAQVISAIKTQKALVLPRETYLNDIYARYPSLQACPISPVIGVRFSTTRLEARGSIEWTQPITIYIHHTRLTIYSATSILNEQLSQFLHRSVGHLNTLLDSIIHDPDLAISYLPLLTTAEQDQLLVKWNQTERDYPRDKTVHQLFEEQVAKTPERIAVVCEDKLLTYGELNEKANQVAHHLLACGVTPGQSVALCVERNIDMLVALLGIIKVGGVYVPIDPDYPEERIQYILEDSQANVILTQSVSEKRLRDCLINLNIILLDKDSFVSATTPNQSFIKPSVFSNAALYIIYTSGSTGRPKGVVVSHRNVVNLVSHFNHVEFKANDCVGQTSNIMFDGATFEIWGSLLHGAKLVIFPKQTLLSIANFSKTIQTHHISILWLTAALFNEIVKQNAEPFYQVDKLLIGGEKLNASIVQQFIRHRKDKPSVFLNGYGPTEATTFSTSYKIPAEVNHLDSIPIGKPINNVQCYVADKNMQLVPAGVTGELLIGGEGVSSGYLNQSKKTQAQFITNPFFIGSVGRLYRTGDTVRQGFDGTIDYIGRHDEQVKIRGFRIELGEIEFVLRQHPQISEAVAAIRTLPDNHKQLEVYFISKKTIANADIKQYLQQRLPTYMNSAALFEVPRFPLTPNGKVDKTRLLTEATYLSRVHQSHQPATTPTQQLLQTVWQQALKQTSIGIDDNFFSRGGDSIIAMQVVSRAEQVGLSFSVQDLFKYSTIEALATIIEDKNSVACHPHTAATWDEPFALAPIQNWFFSQSFIHPEVFSQVCLLTFFRMPDVSLLRQGLAKWITNHPALKLSFRYENDGWQQRYQSTITDSTSLLRIIELAPNEANNMDGLIEEWSYQLQVGFDVQKPPLISAVLFHSADKTFVKLLIAVHHLIIDGMSWRILLNELSAHLESDSPLSCLQANPSHLQKPGDWNDSAFTEQTSYQTWIKSLYDYMHSEAFLSKKHHWAEKSQVIPYQVPRDKHVDVANLEKYTATIETVMTEAETACWLQTLPSVLSIKSHEILIALLAKALADWSQTNEVTIDLESHGRHEWLSGQSLSDTVGWFTTLFPCHFTINHNLSYDYLIKSLQQQCQMSSHQGIDYGIWRYLSGAKNDTFTSDVVFNCRGQLDHMVDSSHFTLDQLKLVSDPENTRTHLLSVEAFVKQKKLHLLSTYHTEIHEPRTIESIAHQMVNDLRHLITTSQTIDRCYPLFPLQKGLLFHGVYTAGSEAYVTQLVWETPKNIPLNINALKQAFNALIARHDSLRAYFIWEGLDEPLHRIKASVEVPWQIYDWANNKESTLSFDARLSTFLKADREVGFQLDIPPLLRIALIKRTASSYCFVLTFHHILLDGWSLPILLDELNAYYQSSLQHTTPNLPAPPSYEPYFQWLMHQPQTEANAFWKQYLNGFSGVMMDWGLTTLQLPSKTLPSPNPSSGFVDMMFEDYRLSDPLSAELKQFCQVHGITLNTLFQGVWALLLHHYSQSDVVVFGITLAGRPPEVKEMDKRVGLFINTLPLRVNFKENVDVNTYLKDLQNNAAHVSSYQATALTDIHGATPLMAGAVLFNTIFVFENYQVADETDHLIKFDDIQIINPTHYPLSATVMPGESFTLRLAFNQQQLDHQAVQRFANQFIQLLTHAIQSPDKNIHDLTLLSPQEQQEMLFDWNQTAMDYPLNYGVHQLFEIQVEKTPFNTAIMFEHHSLSYTALNQRANQLAHYLHQQGVTAETIVGVCVARGFDMVVSLLGILKVGGAYMPVDPAYPVERMRYMLEDGQPALVITQMPFYDQIKASGMSDEQIVCIDDDTLFQQQSIKNLSLPIASHQLMYVLYTSGSTGRPKGVLVEHGSVVNLLWSMKTTLQPTIEDRWLAVTPITFDISGLELYLPLLVGACCVIASHETTTDGIALKNLLEQEHITLLQATPLTWQLLVEAGWTGNKYLKALCGGEAFSGAIAAQILPRVKYLWNMYGPTETTIWSAVHPVTPVDTQAAIVPIGKPIANTQIYVLDHHLQPVPTGVVGELYIGGAGLARGYLNQLALTEERFILYAFSDNFSERLYQTGDQVCWLPDGTLAYRGRKDDQVKLHGFRIELGEIQATLEKHPDIQQAAVLLHENSGKKWLAAYFVAEANVALEPESIKAFLMAYLPAHYVPTVIKKLDEFPVTPHGKMNKEALQAMQEIPYRSHSYKEPEDPIEKEIALIWKTVLDTSSVGSQDNFFALGGHSLTALQVLSRVNEAFHTHLSVKILFMYPTVADFSKAVQQQQADKIARNIATAQDKSHLMGCLIPLKPEGRKTPLFLIHPIGGTVFWYIPMVKYFDPDRPLYAIQDPGIDSDSIPFDSFEELAAFYIQMIKKIQPQGPYLLAGSSAGGNLSVEMAYQLKNKGESVAFIGLLDAWAYYPESLLNQEYFESLMRRQYHNLHREFMAKGIQHAEQFLELQFKRIQMSHRYQPPSIDFPLTLFKAADTLPLFKSIESPANRWEDYTAKNIVTYRVPGDHETMFQDPQVVTLVHYLNQCLCEENLSRYGCDWSKCFEPHGVSNQEEDNSFL